MGERPDKTTAMPRAVSPAIRYEGEAVRVHTDDGGVVRVTGEIDAFNAAPLRDAFEPCLTSRGPLRLDLTSVAFMDGGGLRALLQLEEQLGARLEIVGLSPSVALVLDATGTAERFLSRPAPGRAG
jgi:anti-anti-sigma factor